MTGLGIAVGLGSARTAQVDRPRDDARKNDANSGRQGHGDGTGQGRDDPGDGLVGLGLGVGDGPNVGVSLDVARIVSVDVELNLGLGGAQGDGTPGRAGAPAQPAGGQRAADARQSADGQQVADRETGHRLPGKPGTGPATADSPDGQTGRVTPKATPGTTMPDLSERGPAALAKGGAAPEGAISPMAAAFANGDSALASATAALRLAGAEVAAAANLGTAGGTLAGAGIALAVVLPNQDRITRLAQGLGLPTMPRTDLGQQGTASATGLQAVTPPLAVTVNALREAARNAAFPRAQEEAATQARSTPASNRSALQQALWNPTSQNSPSLAAPGLQSIPVQTVRDLAAKTVQTFATQATQIPAAQAVQNLAPQSLQDPATRVLQNAVPQAIPTAVQSHKTPAVESPAPPVVQNVAAHQGGSQAAQPVELRDRTIALAAPPEPASTGSSESIRSPADLVSIVAPRRQASESTVAGASPRFEELNPPPAQMNAQPGSDGIPVAAAAAKPADPSPATSPSITAPMTSAQLASATLPASAMTVPTGPSGVALSLFNPFLARRSGKRRRGGGLGLASRAGRLSAILRLFGRGRRSQVLVADHAPREDRAQPRLLTQVKFWLRRLVRRPRRFPKRSD